MKIAFWNLKHDPISFDMDKFRFDFTTMKKDNKGVVFLTIPLIKHFALDYNFEYHAWPLKGKGKMRMESKNT